MKKVKNNKLRKIIKLINSAKLKNTLLTKALFYDEHLKLFADEILEVLGFKEEGLINLNNTNK